MIDLSIIIPTYNTKSLLAHCLKSIFKETQKTKLEVIVFDNGSRDGTVSMIRNKFPQVRLISSEENLGFARANNQALRLAQGKLILFLNSDTIILDQAIEKATDFMRDNRGIDILGCQLLNKNKTIQPSVGFFPHLGRVFSMMFFLDDLPLINLLIKPYHQERKNFYNKLQRVDWVTGAFLLIKREVINKIKGFDERFFMYGEEVDFCYQAKKAGFKAWFYPQAQIIHFKGKSSPDGFQSAILGEYQGLKKFFEKNKSFCQLTCLRFYLRAGAVLRMIIFGILRHDKVKREVYEKAFSLA